MISPTPPAARVVKCAIVRSEGWPSAVPYIVSIGDMTIRLRSSIEPIRPGANRWENIGQT